MARGKFLVVLLAFCLLIAAVSAKKAKAKKPAEGEENAELSKENTENEEISSSNSESEEAPPSDDVKQEAPEGDKVEKDADSEDASEDPGKAFKCNVKYQRVGCYKDKGKKQRPLATFIMNDAKIGMTQKKGKTVSSSDFDKGIPEFTCKCANEALRSGNAIFGLQNLAECWTGPDDSKFDQDGASESCVTFGFKPCEKSSSICAGKKHANFVYYVESPEHDKTKEEAEKELAALKKEEEKKKKEAAKAKAKKGKKGKKHGKKQ